MHLAASSTSKAADGNLVSEILTEQRVIRLIVTLLFRTQDQYCDVFRLIV